MQKTRLLLGEIGDGIHDRYGGKRVPDWKVRRIVDDLGSRQLLTVERVGRFRIINVDDLEIVASELNCRGWLDTYVPSAESITGNESTG